MSDSKRKSIKASFEPVKQAMQEQNLTYYQLAQLAKVNHSTLYCWANGDYMPKLDKIAAISKVLKIPIENILESQLRIL